MRSCRTMRTICNPDWGSCLAVFTRCPYRDRHMRPALAATGLSRLAGGGCVTGGIAIGDAFEAIRSGRAAMMLAGASESLSGNGAIWNMDALRLLSREQKDITKASCPFSRDRNGFVLAEGAAVLCLEEREAAFGARCDDPGEIKGTAIFQTLILPRRRRISRRK